ncbi:hypothetical protein J2T17_006357 [Paenibacillus mucilaginosus]
MEFTEAQKAKIIAEFNALVEEAMDVCADETGERPKTDLEMDFF